MVKKFLSRYFGFKKEIYVLFVSRIVNCIGAFVHPLLTLILKNKLGMNEADVGWLMTLMLITQLPSMLIGGKLSDRFGRVKLVAIFQSLGAAIYCMRITPNVDYSCCLDNSSIQFLCAVVSFARRNDDGPDKP